MHTHTRYSMANSTQTLSLHHRLRALISATTLLCGLLAPWNAMGQLSYTFQTEQTGAFTSSSSSNSLIAQAFDDEVFTRTLAPGFNFNGILHTQMHISANGFITFGTAPAGTEYTPISSAVGYSGVIAAFAADLEPASTGGNNRRITFQQTGANIIIQWQRVKRKGTNEYFDCGIRLNTSTGEIRLEYGGINTLDFAVTHQPQVGLRGANNNFAAGNVLNRLVGTGPENWGTSLAGTTNNSRVRFTNANPAKSWTLGMNYVYATCVVGQACNDGDACTINDQINASCNCVGTFQDTDNDTVCDANDGCPLDPNKTAPGACGCGVADIATTWYADTDNDGFGDPNDSQPGFTCDQPIGFVANNTDLCPSDPNKTAPGACGCGVADEATTWYADTDNDGFGDPNDSQPGFTCDQPSGYVANNTDDCPTVPGTVGSACDDGNNNTTGDVLDANCNCIGTPIGGCTENITLDINTDLDGDDITWEIQDQNNASIVYCSGGPYAPGIQVNISEDCCLAQGCYVLVMTDAGGDGMLNGFNGGYTLRTAVPDNRRIIDNRNNGDFGATSQITGNAYSFCVPVGIDRLIYTSCDKYWWKTGEYIVANANDLVSAEWVPNGANSVQPDDSGYEFWIYAPNSGYSFRKFRPHNVSDNFGPASAYRACHMKINNWNSALHVPPGELMNVKVRGRVQGVNQPWGPACRMVRDEALALCPPTKLMDIPGNQFLSCNQFRQFVSNQRIHARPVSGATQYEWRFRIPDEGIEILRSSTTYFLNLGWSAAVAPPLEATKTYEVEVRALKNGTWCGTSDPWGDICSLTIGSPVQGGGTQMDLLAPAPQVKVWPNPSTGNDLRIQVEGIPNEVDHVTVQLFDLTGKAGMAQRFATTEGSVNATLEPSHQLATGIYLMKIIVGDHQITERLLIER